MRKVQVSIKRRRVGGWVRGAEEMWGGGEVLEGTGWRGVIVKGDGRRRGPNGYTQANRRTGGRASRSPCCRRPGNRSAGSNHMGRRGGGPGAAEREKTGGGGKKSNTKGKGDNGGDVSNTRGGSPMSAGAGERGNKRQEEGGGEKGVGMAKADEGGRGAAGHIGGPTPHAHAHTYTRRSTPRRRPCAAPGSKGDRRERKEGGPQSFFGEKQRGPHKTKKAAGGGQKGGKRGAKWGGGECMAQGGEGMRCDVPNQNGVACKAETGEGGGARRVPYTCRVVGGGRRRPWKRADERASICSGGARRSARTRARALERSAQRICCCGLGHCCWCCCGSCCCWG